MNVYLNTINLATIPNIKRVHDKDEDDALKDGLAGAVENEAKNKHLGYDDSKNFWGG